MSEPEKHDPELIRMLSEHPFDDSPNAAHRETLHRQVLSEFDRIHATNSVVQSWNQKFDSWRQFMRRPIPRLIAVSIICLTIVAPWLFFPSQQTEAFAFNNLASAIVEAKTAKFKMETKIEGQASVVSQAYYLAPGKMRMEMGILGAGSVAISDDETLKIVMLMPLLKTATVTTPKGRPKDKPSDNPFVQLRRVLTDSNGAKKQFKQIEEKEIDGKRATGYRSETAIGTFTIWGDLTTGKLLRTESIFNGTKTNEVVMSEIEINVELDEKLFDMTPPDGYKVQEMEVDLSPASEQNLIDTFRSCGEMSGGELPSSIGLMEPMTFYFKHSKEKLKALKEKKEPAGGMGQLIAKEIAPLQRGFMFALELPDSADAHYAGKGVKQGTINRPIFWYRPKDSKKYRVIYADLTVKESDAAPSVDGAVRLIKAAKGEEAK